jgi:hypothetical protein
VSSASGNATARRGWITRSNRRCLIVLSFDSTYQRETRGRRAQRSSNLSAAPCEHQSIWILWGERTLWSILTFCSRTAVFVSQVWGGSIYIACGSSRFLVPSATLKFRQQQKVAVAPAETSSLCRHAFVSEIRCDRPILRPELVSLKQLQSSFPTTELSAR